MAIVKDLRGKEFDSSVNYSNIVSLSPSISELLYDLNMETKLKGLTSLCDEPKYLRDNKTLIGDLSEVNFEALKNLNPELIIYSEDDNMAIDLSELDKIADVFVFNVVDIESNKKLISDLGTLFKKRNESMKINLKIDKQIEDLKHVTSDLQYRKGIYFIWNDPWVAVGKETYINSVMELLRVENPFKELKERYPSVTPANIKLAHTDIVILPIDEPYAFSEEDAIGIAGNTHDASLFFVDGKMFSRYGSRLIKSLDYFKLLAIKFKEMA